MQKNFLQELRWRGMLQDFTQGAEKHLETSRIGYIGFDPTAPSLTIGNLVQVMLLRLFQACGNTPLVVMGGATGRIGDPSGKDKERDLKSFDELDANIIAQKAQFHKLLNFSDGSHKAIYINNFDFYANLNVLDFLRNVGKNLTVNYMLSKESVKRRLDTGISYTEFSYQLLQAYDYYCLHKQYQCTLQMGGSDQWGNIMSGTDYIKKNISEADVHALTTPLLTKANGQKFGKSEEGNIWIDANLTSPYKFYQFWINAEDETIPKLLRYFTLKSEEEILALDQLILTDPRKVKHFLAEEITTYVHDAETVKDIQQVSELLFNKDCNTAFLQGLNDATWKQLKEEISTTDLPSSLFSSPVNIADLLAEHCHIVQSKSDARRAIQGNAVTLNKHKISDIGHSVNLEDFIQQRYMLIENGKKNKYLLILR